MAFGVRAALRLIFVVLIALSAASGAGAKEPKGVPKSAPAFTKFMAEFIHEAMPQAKIGIAGRLRLDVEMPNGKKTADLHDVYNKCHDDPHDCPEATTEYVAAVVSAFKTPTFAPPQTPDPLRIVVRTSAYIDAIRRSPGRNRPIVEPLAGDFWLLTVIDDGQRHAIADEEDLKTLRMTMKEAFGAAMENTKPFAASILHGAATGKCAILWGGDYYITSTVAFPDLWAPFAHHCHDSLIVAIPDRGSVVIDDGSTKDGLASLRRTTDKLFATADNPLSNTVLRWTPKGWVTVPLSPK
jgi:uncharacterized protein YtpQ (UPF0354 family)